MIKKAVLFFLFFIISDGIFSQIICMILQQGLRQAISTISQSSQTMDRVTLDCRTFNRMEIRYFAPISIPQNPQNSQATEVTIIVLLMIKTSCDLMLRDVVLQCLRLFN